MLDLTVGTILSKDAGTTDAFFPSILPSFLPFFLKHSWCEVLQRKMRRGGEWDDKLVPVLATYNVKWGLQSSVFLVIMQII